MLNHLEISRSQRTVIHGRPHVSRRKCDVPRFQLRERLRSSLNLMRMWSIGAQPIGISNMISEPNPMNADGYVANQLPRPQKHVTPAISCTCFCCADTFASGVDVIE